jgi:hypothetical protein
MDRWCVDLYFSENEAVRAYERFLEACRTTGGTWEVAEVPCAGALPGFSLRDDVLQNRWSAWFRGSEPFVSVRLRLWRAARTSRAHDDRLWHLRIESASLQSLRGLLVQSLLPVTAFRLLPRAVAILSLGTAAVTCASAPEYAAAVAPYLLERFGEQFRSDDQAFDMLGRLVDLANERAA